MICLHVFRRHLNAVSTLQAFGKSAMLHSNSYKLSTHQRTAIPHSLQTDCCSPLGFIVKRNCSQANSDPTEDQMALARLEYESCKLDGVLEIPSQLSELHWEELALKNSTHQKRKFLRFLFLSEMKKLNDKKRNVIKREYSSNLREIKLIEKQEYLEGNRHIIYGLWNNTYLMKYGKAFMNRFYNHNAVMAKVRGQHIVYDSGFTSMNSEEEMRAAEQFSLALSENRQSKDPFYVHLCNHNLKSRLHKKLVKTIPTMMNTEFPLDIHEESYLRCFPKDQLVYLTPHCNTELKEFDHDAVYIIGYLVDIRDSDPLSLAKAKKENIKMRKLPLDKYLNWGSGQKSLTLNQMLGIMQEVKQTGSWVKAFEKHIPTRKLKKPEQMTALELKNKMRRERSTKLFGRDRQYLKSLFEE